ncbi:glycosyltransferase family 4 protein [Thermodesulfovibrionales bacterium]|nr:glycosyltransferase family 4 protein [Thermodesulfovibrionales bacterium]
MRGVKVCLVSMTAELAMAPLLKKREINVFTLKHQGNIYKIGRSWQSIKKLKAILKKENPDILHSHLYLPDLFAYFAAPLGCRLVTTLHSIDSWWDEKWRLRSLLKTGINRFLGQVRGVRFVAVSEEVKEAARQALHIPEKRIRTIYNGVNLRNFQVKNRFKVGNSPMIIQVGRFYKEKGHLISLKALQVIKRFHPEARLVLVGDGPQRLFIEDEVKRLGLTESVDFLGVRDDVSLLLQRADVYWMPSEWEGLPIAALEAMACGLPVIASSVGGLREVVLDEETGYLVPKGSFEQFAEKTLQILADSNLARQMGLAGRQRVEQFFSIEKTADSYLTAYNDLIRRKW